MFHTVTGLKKAGIALAVTDDGRLLTATGRRRRRPVLTCLFIANVNDLTRRITNRIIAPGSQAIRLAVACPRVTAATFGDQAAEVRVCQDVDPRRRRSLAAAQSYDILPSIWGEPTKTVVEKQRCVRASRCCLGAYFYSTARWD